MDDSSVLRTLTVVTLGGIGGYVIDEAADARAALELLTAHHYDAIITDHFMPGMDGTELVRQVRKRPEYLHTPIVMLFGEQDAFLEEEARSAGADALVVKPFQPAQMRGVLKGLLTARMQSPRDGVRLASVGTQSVLDAIPYPAMVLDAHHQVVLGNERFWTQSGTGIEDSCAVCSVSMHDDGEPDMCPLSEAIRTGRSVERTVCGTGGEPMHVSVYPMTADSGSGERLFLHLTRPA